MWGTKNAVSYDERVTARRRKGDVDGYAALGQEQVQVQVPDGRFVLQSEVDYQNALIEERAREIDRIAQSIEDVAIITQDLAMLVNEQGGMLDNIEANIEDAVEHTERAVEDLRSADRSQRKRRSRLVKLYSGLAVVGVGVGLFFSKPFRLFF